MKVLSRTTAIHFALAVLTSATLFQEAARADTVTNWNRNGILAIKGASSEAAGFAGNALDTNLSSRILAIQARAVYDAVNTITPIKSGRYYYFRDQSLTNRSDASASAAAAQAAHDVLVTLIPVSPTSTWSATAWTTTVAWLDAKLAGDLAALGVNKQDAGIVAGKAAAQAAIAARAQDGSSPVTSFFPVLVSSPATIINNPSATISATVSVGVGVWRPTNSGAGDLNTITGAPTGFLAGAIQPKAGIDFNWPSVQPFSLNSTQQSRALSLVPNGLNIRGSEYPAEVAYVQTHGQDISAAATERTNDQLIQALYYKQDVEILTFEAARIASAARSLTLKKNAQLFALLANTTADARILAFSSKYGQPFWRPIDGVNYSLLTNPTTDAITSYSWKPLAATPAHPSNTSGHSTVAAAAAGVLRAYFKSDSLVPAGNAETLTSLPWLIGTNSGTGQLNASVYGGTATTRSVTTFSDIQLQTGRSRIFLGVHYPNDDYQGQTLGLVLSGLILGSKSDPASEGVSHYIGRSVVASKPHLKSLFLKATARGETGFYGLPN